MNYRFVKYQKRYLIGCANLVRQTWNLHKRFKNIQREDSIYISYVRECIDNSEHLELVIDENNKVHGIFFGSIEKRNFILKFKYYCRVIRTKIWLWYCLNRGDFGVKDLAIKSLNISKGINELGEKDSDLFDSEINLFIVSNQLRGKKFGLKLMNNYIDFCKSNLLNSTFLWTDLSCTYSFYEKYGFKLHSTFYHKNLAPVDNGMHNGMVYSKLIN